jgi:formate dehydrogenase major subunit
MAECHPVGFQWVMEARARGATVIHVDPRFTRTSAVADIHVPIRAGSDVVFLGALINHVLAGGHEFRDYVVAYTNASALIREDYVDAEDGDGLFSGWDAEAGRYDPATWALEDGPGDPSLEHPRCVFQVLRRHFARYTPAVVADLCGIPEALFARVADALVAASGRERTAAFCYAVGWTQHSVGAQYIRTAAILQSLLGNIGRPGGGMMALRGHASIQGSTDIPTLFDLLPGYLPMPGADLHPTLDAYLRNRTQPSGAWAGSDALMVSLLKAWWGDAATAQNDWCYDYLPRLTGDHSTYPTAVAMLDGKVEGFLVVGENPAVGSANSKLHRLALAELDWLVVRDLVEVETATFWYDSPEISSGELVTDAVKTEVFLLPAAAHVEKDGTFTNTQRLLQWHHKAVEPVADTRSELWFYFHLGRIIREKLAAAPEESDAPVLDLTWDYPVSEEGEPSADAVLREINGCDADGRLLASFTELKADGSTACGAWIYAGCYAEGVNQTARRRPGAEQSWVAPEWGWAWPANRRLLYNRASADPAGRPWSPAKAYVWWDDEAGAWTGHDVPDFPLDKAPGFVPEAGATGTEAFRGDAPFTLQAQGRAALFAPTGLLDGPLPTHYEPLESPVVSPLYAQQVNPAIEIPRHRRNRHHPPPPDADHPFVLTSYRLTEHHTAGGMSRFLGRLSQLQPEMFCEVSQDLAAERGLIHGGWATISTARAAIEARVMVTDRLAPVTVQGRVLHQVGVPWHWGGRGRSRGDAANDLFAMALDPNVHIQEVKAATCDIRRGRRPR